MRRILRNTRRVDITFHRGSGLIRLTARVVGILKIREGDSINIMENEGEYLLYATHDNIGRHRARCYASKRGSGNFCCNSVHLCRLFLDKLGIDRDKASFMTGDEIEIEGEVYLPIITYRAIYE